MQETNTMTVQNMQNAISYVTLWTRDEFITRRVQEIGQALTNEGRRASLFIPGAADNRYLPQPGDMVEDAAEPLTSGITMSDGSIGPSFGRFEWHENGDPMMVTPDGIKHNLGPCGQVRARHGGFTPRTGPSSPGVAVFMSGNPDG